MFYFIYINNETILHIAAKRENIKLIQLLLIQNGIDINKIDDIYYSKFRYNFIFDSLMIKSK